MSSTTPAPEGLDLLNAEDYHFTRKAWIEATPTDVYELVSDVSMIGIWSPSASDVRYDEGSGPEVGSWFGGHNRREGRGWDSRSQVLRAEPGAEFAFVVGGTEQGIVRWRWTMRRLGTGSVVEQSWQLLRLDPVLGTTRADLDALLAHMADSVETTLVSLARWVAENSRNR